VLLQAAERELSAAYGEVAALQAALQDREDDIVQLQDRMEGEAQQWVGCWLLDGPGRAHACASAALRRCDCR
jgi:hypothetical protein